VPTFEGRVITLGDLSSHAAGLRRNPKGMLGRWLRDRRNPYAGLSVEDVHEGLGRTRLRRRPGGRVRYSNLGAGLLGQAQEKAAGLPYERLVRERICLPLGMADTVVVPSTGQAARVAVGHTRRGRPVPRFEIPGLARAGALRSTATDMLRFLGANLDPASTPLAAQLERTQWPRHRMGRGMQVGLGWLIVRSPEPAGPLLWHNGGTNGFRSFVGVVRDSGTAVVVLSNGTGAADGPRAPGGGQGVQAPHRRVLRGGADADRPAQPPTSVQGLFAHVAERWDGKGQPGRARREEIPLAMRIVHVARDAAFQRMLGGDDFAAAVIRKRAGGALDPAIATRLADQAPEIFAAGHAGSVWEETLAVEPRPCLVLEGEAIDRALGAMGDFADLASPYLVGHSAGVADLATAAARRCRFDDASVVRIRRAALVHDLGRVAVPVRIWQKAAPLTPDDRERVRLHAYHSERVLARSPFLASLVPVATFHHERLDGSGYHRGTTVAALTPPARLLAAADAYHAMTEPRPHRPALAPEQAAEALGREAGAGRVDPDAVAAVVEAAGQRPPRIERPAGLTRREAEVVALLARGLQTKQVARRLRISVKTADRHVQNAYAKIGVSTRAAAALFAMEHGLTAWGELPIGPAGDRP
jgi:HD-GYP domain-containing protein (c-di-GMP phosphodiesterase class II)